LNWNQTFPKSAKPTLEEIEGYIQNPLWQNLCAYLEEGYGVLPSVEHSICSGAPGWSVKYKKGGRALCTLYPGEGSFTALVTIGAREAAEAELLLNAFSEDTRKLYVQTAEHNGARWLMIRVDDARVLSDVKALITLRVPVCR